MTTDQMTADRPRAKRHGLAPQQRRAEARRMYRESVAAELPMTAEALGSAFGRSARWGRDRIAEVRAEDAGRKASDVGMPSIGPAGEHAEDGSRPHDPTRTGPGDGSPAGMPRAGREGSSPPAGMPAVERRGRVVAWLAFLFGIAATVAANVGHKFYPTAEQLDWWHAAGNTGAYQPEPGSVLGAAFWPLALLLAVEVMSRVAWPDGGWWRLARYGGMLAVAGVAALISYRHMSGLLTAWGEDTLSARLGPLAVDGLMVLAGLALLSMGARRQ